MSIPTRAIYYQWESLLYRKQLERRSSYNPQFAYKVLKRHDDGTAQQVRFQVYVNDPSKTIILIGEHNDWGKKKRNEFTLTQDDRGFAQLTTDEITHKQPYLYLIISHGHEYLLRDPAATYLDSEGNSVFWDFDDPTAYRMQYPQPDTLHRATKILQTDPVGLVAKWFEYDTKWPTLAASSDDLFTFIATCGVLDKVKELGFNTLQFLPITQSIDGDNWKFRYLVTHPFALHRNFGNPDSFKRLVDECHKRGIAVICDLIISHCPYKEFALCGMRGEDVGLHRWSSKHGSETYLEEETPWGTKRFRYGDEHVRRFLTESALLFAIHYRVDGFRIDNVDGILRYGDAGDGPDRPFGRQFLRELIGAVYEVNPLALIHLESHYFYGDNAKMLVAPLSTDARALGATAYNSSRITYYFHKEFMPKAVEDISVWRFEHIREEKEWGRSNSTIADFHNHDAAAGLMHGRATGSYAYDALILKNPDLDFHARGKIKVMEAIISCGCEGRTLDLLQTFLLQLGTFEHDSSIHWNLLREEKSARMICYKQAINKLMEHPAFWPENTLYRQYVNVDEQNKILVIKRVDRTQDTKEEFIIVINLSSRPFFEYAVGVVGGQTYKVMLNSDEEKYGGTHESLYKYFSVHTTDRFAVFTQAITIPRLSPYQIIVVKKA